MPCICEVYPMGDLDMRLAARLLLGTALVLAGGVPASWQPKTAKAQAQTPGQPAAQNFDIPAQPLNAALDAFARSAGWQVGYPASLAQGKTSSALRGSFSPREALSRMLTGTGLTYRITGSNTVTLAEAPQGGGAAVLPPISVEGQQTLAETAWGPVEGYRASRSATATKTDTPILETPASIQVVPRQVIDEQKALNLRDVYENVSSVQQAGNTLNAQTEVLPIIRGFESPVLLRNGLRSTQVGAVDLIKVEKVEVLKGPASILYGTLQPGGVINYVTKRPQDIPQHAIEQQVGSYDFYRTTMDTTGPLTGSGDLLYRLNAAYTDSESFRDEIELERSAFAPSLLWRPGDRTELLLDLSYMRETQPYDTGIPLGADGKPLAAKEAFFNDPDLKGRELTDYSASYQLSHEFNSVWNLRNQMQFHRAEAKNESLRPRGISANNQQLLLRYQNEDRRDDEFQTVLDGTAKFSTGAADHTLLLGAELSFIESDFRRFRTNTPNVTISDDPVVNYTPPTSQPKEVNISATRWLGFYAQDQLALLEDGRLKLLLGGRYDAVHQENRVDDEISPDVNDRALTGRAGLLYEFTRQYSAYVSVAQSFLPQSPGTVDQGGSALDPEEGLQYETGIKGSFLEDRLSATAAIFAIEKSNVAVFDQALFNAAGQRAYFPGVRQRSRGFEFDLVGALTPQVNVIANYSYTDTEVLENAGSPTTVGGPLFGVPSNKARLWLTYDFAPETRLGGLGLGGGVRYVDTSTAQFANVELQPYTVFDAAVWYRWNAIRAGLNIYNLFDENYILRASDRNIAHPGAPLTAIASISVQF